MSDATNTFRFNNKICAVMIAQASFSLFQGVKCLADNVPSQPYELDRASAPADFFGTPCAGETTYGAPLRPLTDDEQQADAVFVTQVGGPAMIAALRADGFRGAIYAPGMVVDRPDGKPGKTAVLDPRGVTLLSPALP